MFTQKDILSDFQRMYREHWNYVWGHHETGCVDCSGAFVWSYDQHGKNIYNGSNRIARVHVKEVIPIAEARASGLIVPGVAAFKTYKPGNQYYDLKDTYKPGGKYYNGDLNDYHHIGLIDEDIDWVLNAQGAKTGFVRSRIKENWTHIGYLLAVTYEGVKPMAETKMMIGNLSPGTGTVNMRREPSTGAFVVDKLKAGTVVTKTGEQGVWSSVKAQGKSGWIMSQFLVPYSDNSTNTSTLTLEQRVANLEQRVSALELR